MSSHLILFNKPFRVMTQFSPEGDKVTLADYIQIPDFYPAGRLDFDSEGLLLLTDQGTLQHIITSPDFKMPKTYWVQVEGNITEEALTKLRQGVELKDGLTKLAQAELIEEPNIWQRTPPVRHREQIPTSWISLQICEGKNRQVRRMTAAVGFPTLRLIRYAIGPYTLDNIPQGQWSYAIPTDDLLKKVIDFEERKRKKTASSNRRGPGEKRQPANQRSRIPYGEGVARRKTRPQPASRTHRK